MVFVVPEDAIFTLCDDDDDMPFVENTHSDDDSSDEERIANNKTNVCKRKMAISDENRDKKKINKSTKR